MTRADLLAARRADERPGPADGAGVPRLRPARPGSAAQTVFLSSHILSEVEALCDRVAILRAGHLVEVGTLAEMRHLSALQVEAELDGSVPDLSTDPGRERVGGRRRTGPLPGDRLDRAVALGARLGRRAAPHEPGAVARGAVPRPLRRGPIGGGLAMRLRRDVYGERRASRVVAVTTARRAGRQGVLWGLRVRGDDRRVRVRVPVDVPDRGLAGAGGAPVRRATPPGRRCSGPSAASTRSPATPPTRR